MNSAAAATSLTKSGVVSAASGIVRCVKTRSLDRSARGVTTSKALTQSSLFSQSKVNSKQKSTLAVSHRSMSTVSPPSSYSATSSRGSVGDLSGSTRSHRGRGRSDSGIEFLSSGAGLSYAAIAVAAAVLITSDRSEDKIGGGVAGKQTVSCRARDAAGSVHRVSPSSSAPPSAAADTPRVSSDLSLNAQRFPPGLEDPDPTDDYSTNRCGSPRSSRLDGRGGHGSEQRHPADDRALKELEKMRRDSSLANPAAKEVDCSTRITDVYKFDGDTEQVVGRGSRSVVSSARHRLTGQRVAVKKLSREETTRVEVNQIFSILLTVVVSAIN